MKNFLFQSLNLVSVVNKKKRKKKKKKKRSQSNDFGSDEYSYSILYSDPRISEYSDTLSSSSDGRAMECVLVLFCQQHLKVKSFSHL